MRSRDTHLRALSSADLKKLINENKIEKWYLNSHPHFPRSKIYFTPLYINLQSLLETLQWRHNEHDGVSNHQPNDCLLKCSFRRRSKKTSKLRVTGVCEENSPVTGEFPLQRASDAGNVSIWWCHHWVYIGWCCVAPGLIKHIAMWD